MEEGVTRHFDPTEVCPCGHTRAQHIYYEGACRPGFVCLCPKFGIGVPHFDGATYEAEFDHTRLGGQMGKVYVLMSDGHWRTLDEISNATGAPPASVSARLRDLRKPKFGAHTVERRARGPRENGLFEYRLLRREAT